MVNPLLSVIVPIHNSEKYLTEALNSVLNQRSGIFESMELILVDDGSTDNSNKICEQYVSDFPLNIRYIRQKKAGVSAARNAGLAQANGYFVHFLDSDDVLSEDFYAESIKFLQTHKEVDFVASKLMFFDAIIDSHPLNTKFDSTKVINVAERPDSPILHVISCVFRRDALAGHQFNDRLAIAEDVAFISEVLSEKGHYGVLSNTTYHYRKRTDNSSAIGGKERSKHYYLDVPKLAYLSMIETWKDRGAAARWPQYTILYDIAYRLRQKTQTVLSASEVDEYKTLLRSVVEACDTDVIAKHRFLTIYQKLYLLKLSEREHNLSVDANRAVTLNNIGIYKLADSSVHIDFLTHVSGTKYKMEGFIKSPVKELGFKSHLSVSGKNYPLRYVSRIQLQESFLGEVYRDGSAFEVEFDFPIDATIKVFIEAGDDNALVQRLDTGPFTRFGALRWTYRRDTDRLIKRRADELVSSPYSKLGHMILELRMLLQITLNWRLNTAKEQLRKLRSRNLTHLSVKAKLFEIAKPGLFVAEALYKIPGSLLLRIAYYVTTKGLQKPIWIISDRGMSAGDNGEAFLRYVATHKGIEADVYFAISKDSKDYDRVRSIGKVLNHGSFMHKLRHLQADKIISSQADIETTNPFIRQFDHFADLMNFDFVFLQHGVIRHDLSDWLNRFNKNIGLFITTSKKEYDSIFSNPYYYDRNQVIMSGLARYDLLQSNPKKKIILAPTYRKNLVRMKTDKNGARKYDPLFKNSQYREFYNGLMNDERLRKAMNEFGVSGEFYLHPTLATQAGDYDGNSDFSIMKFPYDYRKAFEQGSLLISDHSSVVFDFAYLRKPVLYAHFDVDTFFEGHTYSKSDFFSDTDDGFGEVCADYESLVDATITLVRRNFTLEEKYRQRIDAFFVHDDTDNSKRIYNAMIERER